MLHLYELILVNVMGGGDEPTSSSVRSSLILQGTFLLMQQHRRPAKTIPAASSSNRLDLAQVELATGHVGQLNTSKSTFLVDNVVMSTPVYLTDDPDKR